MVLPLGTKSTPLRRFLGSSLFGAGAGAASGTIHAAESKDYSIGKGALIGAGVGAFVGPAVSASSKKLWGNTEVNRYENFLARRLDVLKKEQPIIISNLQKAEDLVASSRTKHESLQGFVRRVEELKKGHGGLSGAIEHGIQGSARAAGLHPSQRASLRSMTLQAVRDGLSLAERTKKDLAASTNILDDVKRSATTLDNRVADLTNEIKGLQNYVKSWI